jgi:DNA invertase Pin-like site-specific DNA recombinase
MLYGYARVSRQEQDLKRQVKELQEYGVLKENIREEKETGKTFQKREVYQKLVEECQAGDKIVCVSLDRFSRSVRETTKEIERLEERGITVVFIKENIDTSQKGISQLILSIFSWVAEQERLNLLDRQAKAYQALKKDEQGRLVSSRTGKPVGRQPKELTSRQLKLLEDFKAGKLNISNIELANLLGVSKSFLYRRVLK